MPGRSHLILGGCLALLAGCGFGPVDVEPYEPEPGSSAACTELLGDLPETVDDAVRREISPADAPVAAWGQPAIVLRCGVGLPSSYRPDARLFDVDGVSWLIDEGEGGTFFTAVDRAILVELAVPDDYSPEAAVLSDLAEPILEHLPERALP